MGAYCHTTVGCACALRAHPPPTTARASRLASIAGFAYNLCLCPTGPPTQKKIKKIIKGPIQLGVRPDNILSRIDPLIIPEPMNSARGWLLKTFFFIVYLLTQVISYVTIPIKQFRVFVYLVVNP